MHARAMSPAEMKARILAGHRLAGGSATVPITNSMMAAGGQAFMPLGGPAEAPPQAVGVAVADTDHATNVHVAMILLGAFGVIAFFHLGGFRMAFDVGMGR